MPILFSRVRRLGAGCILVFVMAAGVASGATIGNVTSFASVGPDVTFNISDGSKVRLSILADDMVRVRFTPNGVFGNNISHAVVKTNWPTVTYNTNDNGGSVAITTSKMRLNVNKSPFVLECRDAGNNLILSDDPARRIEWDGSRTEVHKLTQSNEKYVGLGWRTGGLIRNGTIFTMKNVPHYGNPDTFYSGIPFWYGLHNGVVYGVFFDDTSFGRIDVGATSANYMSFENLGGQLDYYYFAGPTMAEVLDRYTELTGRPYMPSRWSIGYQQCRWSYVPQSQLLNIANQLRNRNIPCDVLYLDIDYMPGGTALTFDTTKFPDAAGMLNTLHSMGFKVVANISPFLFTHDPRYNAALNGNYFLKKSSGSTHHGWHDYWAFVGGAPNGNGSLAWIDFTKTSARNWFGQQHASFINLGIDGIWNDLNEPDELGAAWPDDIRYDFDGSPVNHNKTGTQYALFQTEFSYEVLRQIRPNERPFVLSRGGSAGIQRFATLWSGDNLSDWTNDLKRNIPMGLAMSISGNPHNGHDIGGFFGHPTMDDKPSGELYARWMQAGVFSPFCRQHKDGFGNRANPPRPFTEPWEFGGTVENICRDYINLRYRLMPYLYTLFQRAHAHGEPIQRPLLYDFPNDTTAINRSYDFMFGPDMLVSPVTTPQAASWQTYLPAGTDWIYWWDDSIHTGGQTVSTATPLARIPIFVRGGAIIPTAPVVQYEGQSAWTTLTIEAYPVDEQSTFTLYEDDGISWDFQGGAFAETTYTMNGLGNTFTFDINARQGGYVPASRNYVLKVHRWPGHTLAGTLNNVAMAQHNTLGAFNAAAGGYFHDLATNVLWVKFLDTGGDLVFSFGGTPVPNVPGDFDNDGDVDIADFGHFQVCLSGPGVQQLEPECQEAKFDNDVDVDQDDLAVFIECFSGPGIFGDEDCAD